MGQSHRAELSRLRSMMTGQGQSVDEIATAVRARYGYSLRAAYRHAMGWTLDQAAERYNQAADDADAHLSGPRLSEWENWPQTGTRRPTAFNLLILSKVYSTHPNQLVTGNEEERLDHRDRTLLHNLNQPPPSPVTMAAVHPATRSPEPAARPADTGLDAPWTAAGSLRILHVMTDPEAMQPIGRRLFLTLTGAAATTPAHQWLIARAPTEVPLTGSAALPAGIVDHLDTITAELRQMDDQMGGATLLDVVGVLVRQVVGLIENGRYSKAVGHRLYATAAELLRLAGWSCFEANRHADAQRYWVAALHTAHAAGDRALGANILGFMSCQAKDLSQIRESVTLAETARAGYPGASPAVAAILDFRAAEAHAFDHATTECRRALDAAFDRLGNATSSAGEPGWSYWLDDAQLHAAAGSCYVRLQDWERARSHLHDALRLQDAGFSREGTLRRILLAETYLRQRRPDLDQALAFGTQAVDALSSAVNSTRIATRLAPLVKGLAPFRQRPAVRDFTERATSLLTAS
jgi:tetratricopeptide (TPR) repeat protein